MKRFSIFASLFLGLGLSYATAQDKVVRRPTKQSSTQQKAERRTATHADSNATPTGVNTAAIGDKTVTVAGVTFVMKGVQGGSFTMGKTPEQICPEYKAYDGNLPKHKVWLSSYRIGQTEVTQELWQAVMGNNPTSERSLGPQKPVTNVSWYKCQEFISRLNNLTGLRFRLPTEAEWEYAARGGRKSRHYRFAGGNDLDRVAWAIGTGEYKDGHYDVGTKAPNELGIYDMTGNVEEWVNDWQGRYSSRTQVNPQGPGSGTHKVTRGGAASSSYGSPWFWYLSYRSSMKADCGVQSMLGFRLAM